MSAFCQFEIERCCEHGERSHLHVWLIPDRPEPRAWKCMDCPPDRGSSFHAFAADHICGHGEVRHATREGSDGQCFDCDMGPCWHAFTNEVSPQPPEDHING